MQLHRQTTAIMTSPAIYRLGILVGLLFGIILARSGLQGLLTLTHNDNLISVVMLLSYSFSLLPCTLLGMISPRTAGKLLLLCLVIFIILSGVSAAVSRDQEQSWGVNPTPILLFVVPMTFVAITFLSHVSAVSDSNQQAAPVNKRPVGFALVSDWQYNAKWGSIVLGFLLGLSSAPWIFHGANLAWHRRDWVSVTGFLIIAASPIVLSGLAITKPRLAAYGCFASGAVSVLFIFTVWSDIIAIELIALSVVLPLAIIGGLFYASSRKSSNVSSD